MSSWYTCTSGPYFYSNDYFNLLVWKQCRFCTLSVKECQGAFHFPWSTQPAMVSRIFTSSTNFHLTGGGGGGGDLKLTCKCSELRCLCDTSRCVLQGKYNTYEVEETGVWLCAKLWWSFHLQTFAHRIPVRPPWGFFSALRSQVTLVVLSFLCVLQKYWFDAGLNFPTDTVYYL